MFHQELNCSCGPLKAYQSVCRLKLQQNHCIAGNCFFDIFLSNWQHCLLNFFEMQLQDFHRLHLFSTLWNWRIGGWIQHGIFADCISGGYPQEITELAFPQSRISMWRSLKSLTIGHRPFFERWRKSSITGEVSRSFTVLISKVAAHATWPSSCVCFQCLAV